MTIEQKRALITEVPGPRSVELHRRKMSAVASGVGTTLPIYVERAGGGIVVDVDGNQFIDFGSGIAVTTVGNSAPRVVAAVQEQVADFTHTCFMVTPYEEYVAVAEKLNELTPGDHEKRSALFNSGAEAVENAVKIARVATGRQAVIAFDHAYHGRTNLTMALTAKNMPYKNGFGPFAGEVYRVPMAYPYRWPTGPENCADEAFETFVELVHSQVGEQKHRRRDRRADPGRGRLRRTGAGLSEAGRRVVHRARHRLHRRRDPVRFSAGRVSGSHASTRTSSPDLITTAKGIAGGLPLAAVTGRAELMDSVHTGGLGGTYGGNPVACAAALASIEDDGRRTTCAARRSGSRRSCVPASTPWPRSSPPSATSAGAGAMLALELVEPGTTTPNPALTAAIAAACHQAGVITLTAGTFGNVLRFLPPLVIGEDLLREGLDVLEDAFAATA